MKKRNIGSTLDSLLDEMGILAETQILAQKKGIVRAIEARLRDQGSSKAALARLMATSRPQVARLLDASNTSVTLETLARAAVALGLNLEVRLSPMRRRRAAHNALSEP
jgi:antitoxin HicB